jgi:hypothetical protein
VTAPLIAQIEQSQRAAAQLCGQQNGELHRAAVALPFRSGVSFILPPQARGDFGDVDHSPFHVLDEHGAQTTVVFGYSVSLIPSASRAQRAKSSAEIVPADGKNHQYGMVSSDDAAAEAHADADLSDELVEAAEVLPPSPGPFAVPLVITYLMPLRTFIPWWSVAGLRLPSGRWLFQQTACRSRA